MYTRFEFYKSLNYKAENMLVPQKNSRTVRFGVMKYIPMAFSGGSVISIEGIEILLLS